MRTRTEVQQRTRHTALSAIGRAALGAVDRGAFLPVAAREACSLFAAEACEIWTDGEEGLALAAVFRRGDAPGRLGGRLRSLDSSQLAEALAGPVTSGGWLAVPVPGEPKPFGVLALVSDSPWQPDANELADCVATMVGLGIAAMRAGEFDTESRDQFLALLGHDLRSPLSNVRVGAQLASRNLEAGDTKSVREALSIIESQSDRLVSRLEALLDAVSASGRRLMRLEGLDLGSMAEEAADPFRLAARESGSGTSFEVHVEPGAPKARGDAEQIAQVFDHLLDNAAKYAAGGRVTITVGAEGSGVRVEVSDTGPGIRPEDIERVFMPFGRGRSTASRDGFGLGLYLARNILAAHGGRIWIARTSRSGTTMAFTLPAADVPAA